MNKTFCDICGKEVDYTTWIAVRPNAEYKVNITITRRSTEHDGTNIDRYFRDNFLQADICTNCKINIVADILNLKR